MMTTTAGLSATTSAANRAAMVSLRWAFTPWLMTSHSGWACVSQYAYWLVRSPAPSGGASRGDLNAGVPAVVESPIATMRTSGGFIDEQPDDQLVVARLAFRHGVARAV